MLGRQLREGALVVIRLLAELDPGKPQAELGGCVFRRLPLIGGYFIPEHGDRRYIRGCLSDNLKTFFGELDLLERNAGHVAARPRQISHIAARERIVVDGDHNDRPCAGRRQGGLQADLRAGGKQNVHLATRKLPIASLVSGDVRGLHVIEREVLALLVSQLGHALDESDVDRARARLHAGQADADKTRWLLPTHGQRPRGSTAAEQRDELPPPYMSRKEHSGG